MAQSSNVTLTVKVTAVNGGSYCLKGTYSSHNNTLVVYPEVATFGAPSLFNFFKVEGVWKNSQYSLIAEILS